MTEIFTEHELDIAKELINIGLGKAADSMAFFTKNKVFIRGIDIEVKTKDSIANLTQKGRDKSLSILTTEI